MAKSIAESLKKLDVEIGRKMFRISKNLNIELPPSPLQGQILDYLFMNSNQNISGKDLEKFLNVSKVAISNALLSMENKGIIQRIKLGSDRRNKSIILTDKSKKIFNQMGNLFMELEKEMIKGIDTDKLEIFYEVMNKISNNIGGNINDKKDIEINKAI